MKEAKNLLKIIKFFLYEKECILNNEVDEEKIYKLAKINGVSNFLENWAQKYCKSKKVKAEVYKDYTTQIVKDTNENIEIEKILNILEENNIQALVVKGAIMKNIYPQNYMRGMCDIDILVNKNDFKKTSQIMKNMGFSKFYNYEKHLIFTKPPFIIVELHRKLVLNKHIGYEYFKNVWPLCVRYKSYKNIYQLDIENSYVFCILHLLMHFKFTGIKIRDILDVYLYHEKYKDDLNYDKLEKIFNELDIKEFEENIKKISYKWFGTENISDFSDVEKFILKGKNGNNRINYSIGESDGKINFIINLLFPELKIMQEKYPILEKAPILLPVMWVARISKDVCSKVVPLKTRLKTIKLIKEADTEEINKVKDIYKKLGIK